MDREVGLTDSEKSVTVTLAVPFTPPLAAVTVKFDPTVVAVNRPAELIEPTPPTHQLNRGRGFIATLFWSSPVALNCWVPPFWTEAVAGVTVIEVRTGGAAVTVTLAVPFTPPLAAVTGNVH